MLCLFCNGFIGLIGFMIEGLFCGSFSFVGLPTRCLIILVFGITTFLIFVLTLGFVNYFYVMEKQIKKAPYKKGL